MIVVVMRAMIAMMVMMAITSVFHDDRASPDLSVSRYQVIPWFICDISFYIVMFRCWYHPTKTFVL
eukprot:3191544-Rhodomonas_salina.2